MLLTPADTVIKTNNELGEDFEVKDASGMAVKWYEQAAAFAQYVKGLTVEEVAGIKVDEQNYATETALKRPSAFQSVIFSRVLKKRRPIPKRGRHSIG